MCRYAVWLALVGIVGCGQSIGISSSSAVTSRHTSQFILNEEPSDAIGVAELRESAMDGETVTVVGSVGGGIDPWIKGRAAFVLVDACASMECEGSCCEEGCNCHAGELTDSIVMVKFIDEGGKAIQRDAQELLGLQLLDTVVVHGKAARDKAGNVAMVADGVYIRR